MSDRRYDRAGELTARDEVLRVRSYHHADGRIEAGARLEGAGAALARGIQAARGDRAAGRAGGASPHALLAALGYDVVHAIDREVEVLELDGATLRLERYPRMDPLLEVEGEPAAIERAIAATGIDRAAFTADSLAEFVRRFEAAHRHSPPSSRSRDHGRPAPIVWVVPELGPSLGRLVDPPRQRAAAPSASRSTTSASTS